MPYIWNVTCACNIWKNWSSYMALSNNTDPVSGIITSATNANPTLMPIFCGALYVFLWIKFADAPSRFKLVGITALVFVISVVMVAGGFMADAVLNFIAFILAYFLSLLFKA